ncbi:MAG: TonB-dependent receptor [Candidatus Brocadiia bacterium]
MRKLYQVIGGMIILTGIVTTVNSQTYLSQATDEVVVTATKTGHQVEDISGDVTVISSREISESNAQTVDQLLANQAGMNVQGGDFPGSKPRLDARGLSGNYGAQRVLVLIDGRPVNEEYMGDVDLRLISTDNIERIEIVRGPASALYGSSAVGGVINIITKSYKEGQTAGLKTTVGSFNTYSTAVNHGLNLGRMDYFISAGDRSTDGYLKNTDGSPRNWASQNASAKANWKLNDQSSINLALGRDDGRGREDNFIRNLATDYINLTYKNTWSKGSPSDLAVRIYRNGLDQQLEWKAFPFTGRYDQSTLGIQAQQSLQPLKNQLLTIGADSKTEDVLVKEANGTIDEIINSQALYAQDEISLMPGPSGNAMILTLGLRYDRNEEFGSELSPRVGAVYHLDQKTTLRAAVGQAYRAPAVSDLYLPVTPYGPITFQGNPDLNPETLWSYEVGADYKLNADLSGHLTLSRSALKDAWDYMRDPDNIYRPRNVTRMTVDVIEAEAKYRVIEQLDITANYTLNDAVYEKAETDPAIEGKRVEEIPLWQSSLGLRFQANSVTAINLKTRITGQRYTDPANTAASRLNKNAVTELNLSSEINKTSSLFIAVHNLFNRQYKEVIDYYQPGRWFETGFSLKF